MRYEELEYPGAVNVDFLYVEDDPASRRRLVSLGWDLIRLSSSPEEMSTHFASIICAFEPQFRGSFVKALEQHDCNIEGILFPDSTETNVYDLEPTIDYSYIETVILMGISFLLLFKQVTPQNFAGYTTARMKALCGRLSVTEEIRNRRLKYPLTLQQVQNIRSVFGGSKEIKREIIQWMMWASNRGGVLEEMARYMLSILAFSELNVVVLIHEVFVHSGSPVLQYPALQGEVYNFARALHHVCRYKWPQFFKYYCQPDEEVYVLRNQFPILGAAAQKVMSDYTGSESIKNFVVTTNSSNSLVEKCVQMHKRYCESQRVEIETPTLRFMRDEGNYGELLDEEEGISSAF